MVSDVGAIDQPAAAATDSARRTTPSATACWDVTTPSVDGEASIHRREATLYTTQQRTPARLTTTPRIAAPPAWLPRATTRPANARRDRTAIARPGRSPRTTPASNRIRIGSIAQMRTDADALITVRPARLRA